MRLTGGEMTYYALKPLVRSFLNWEFNIQVESNPLKDLKEPYLLLGHHVANEDPIISNAYANTLIRYIAGDANQDHWLKRNLLTLLESIPFTKNRGDAKSIRVMLRHVRDGHPIGLYPEGGRNWDGVTDTLIPSTAKLIKLLKIPVYAAFFKGGHLSRPRWASHPRKGKLVLEIKQLFDKDTVEKTSPEDLYTMLVDRLKYNEFRWQEKNRVLFRGKNLAEHIERLLYVCPSCLAVNSFRSAGDKFRCTACQAEFTVNPYGEILGCQDFQDTAAWNQWQRGHLPRLCQEGFSFTNDAMALEIRAGKQKTKHKVMMNFSPDRLELMGETCSEVIMLNDLSSLSITFQDVVEFYLGKTKYRLTFDPRRHMSVKLFYDLLEALATPDPGK